MFLGEAAVELIVKTLFFWDSERHSLDYKKYDDAIR
jgi:hypothetical protein